MIDDSMKTRDFRRLGALLLTAAALLLFARLGATDLWAPDEPRYAQIADELRSMEHGAEGLILLHLNGAVYTQKPPLYYWAAAALGSAHDRVTEVAARMPSALAGCAIIALTALAGARAFGPRAGILGAALLLTVFEFSHLARRAQLDVLLALFEGIALLAFWRADHRPEQRRRWVAVFHGAMGLAVLTKGPVGFLIPSLTVAVYLALGRRWNTLRAVFPVWALGLSIVPGCLWLWGASALAPTGYLDETVGTNLFARFFSGSSHVRPFYYYAYQFPVDFLPWTLLLPWVWLRIRSLPEPSLPHRFALLCVAVPLVFFSISAGKRGLYLLPAFPAAALLCADAALWTLKTRATALREMRVVALALLVVGLAASAAFLSGREVSGSELPRGMGAAWLAVIAGTVFLWRRFERPLARFGALWVAAFCIELSVFTILYPALDESKSPRPIALAAAELTPPGVAIGLVGNRAMAGGLAYYGERRVAELDSPESVQGFIDAGGQALIVRARQLDRVQRHTAVRIAARARSGRRELLVVTPAAQAAPSE